MNHNSKIRPTHLSRNAYVYVRQSTDYQVQHHLESQQRQYELADHARSLGWSDSAVQIIDDDLGRSASGVQGRSGFRRLVSEVALGQAGVVLGLEVSRLARNNRDWYQLLDLCAAKQTLIADADGIYEPSDYNDRLLLGLKGTMSEAELHILKGRMLAGVRHKAQKGELRFHLPPGYEFDDQGKIVKTSDEQVSHLIELLFAKFFEVGTISGVSKYLQHEGLRMPRRSPFESKMRWVVAYYRAVYLMLNNPIYAGTYAYGRTGVVTDIDVEGHRRSRQRPKAMKDWDVVIHDHHPAYITWGQFERIRKMAESNRAAHRDQASTVIREGSALLQGIVRCGKCGRSMTIRYRGHTARTGRAYPYYCCHSGWTQQRSTAVCQSVGGHRIDSAVSRIFLEEMSKANLDIHLAALRQLDEPGEDAARQLGLQLERARYEAERIGRQYNAVEPENRVVARTLESRWNEALGHVQALQGQLAARRREQVLPLTNHEEQRIQQLAQDLPRLWSLQSVTDKDRKALLRAVFEEVQLLKNDRIVRIKFIWKGGAVTETSVELPRLSDRVATSTDLIELIGKLATRHSDAQIARILIRRGMKTPRKQLAFTARHIASLRENHNIDSCPTTGQAAETYTVEQTAKLFGVSWPTIYSWLRLGVLSGEQLASGAPWAIQVTEADRKRLRAEVPDGWLTLQEAAGELGVSRQTILNWVKAQKVEYVYATQGRRLGLRINVNSTVHRVQARLLD
jgi:DNA invertase Pin-like site-specific DNA recombinase/transposase